MKLLRSFKSIVLLGIGTFGMVACGSIEEPQMQESVQAVPTRGEVSMWKSLTSQQVITLADKAVGKSTSNLVKRNVKPLLLNNRNLSEKLISDTVAFLVNYGEKDGFAVIANDNRLQEPLAYSQTGYISNEPSPVKYLFLDRIESYLANYEKMGGDNGNVSVSGAPTRHFVIEPQINIELGPWYPFNQQISKKYPDGIASLGCIVAAELISTLSGNKDFIYHDYIYNFEKIIYAYNQGPGFFPPTPEVNPTGNAYLNFIFSYDGAVSAFNQLLYDLGEDSNTVYEAPEEGYIYNIGYTNPVNVKSMLSNLGFTVSSMSIDRSLRSIVEKLNDGHLIGMCGLAKYVVDGQPVEVFFTKGLPMWAVDGCDVIVDSEGNPLTGLVHCVWGVFGLGDGFFAYPVLLSEDENYLVQWSYFSVK